MRLRTGKRRGGRIVVGGGGENRWSQTATWGGALPTASDDVVIPAGQTYTLDTAAVFRSLSIAGTLVVDPAVNVSLTGRNIEIASTGELSIGTAAQRYTNQCVITLNGARADGMPSNRYVADQTASSGAGNGRLTRLHGGAGAAADETITVTFTSASAFNVSGSVSGSLGSGTVGTLFNNRVRFIAIAGGTAWANGHTRTITLERRASSNAGVMRSLQVMPGGKLRLHGIVKTHRTRINAHIAASATSMTLAATPTGWLANDEIVIGGTDYRSVASGQPQKLTLSANVSTTTANLSGSVTASRWGLLQYPTDAGVSLTQDTLTRPTAGGAAISVEEWALIPKVLDERAPVINLTRNIRIEAPNDSDWTTDGFGAHLMVMGNTSVCQIDGVEFRRCGQRGILGRYPIHWHMASYNLPDGGSLPSDGTFLGAVTTANNYARRCSVNRSVNRAFVIHGTHGVEISDCVAHDIDGHAFLHEEGSEEGNTWANNVVMKVRSITDANNAILRSDLQTGHGGAAGGGSGYWLSNPNNIVTGNWAQDCEMWGMVNAWAMAACIGQSQEVAIVPSVRPVGAHSGNMVSCNGTPFTGVAFTNTAGMATAFPHTNNRGITQDIGFPSRDFEAASVLLIEAVECWKNERGYYNRVPRANYRGWTHGDNKRIDFTGQATSDVAGKVSFGDRILFINESLNNANNQTVASVKQAVASYHELLSFKNCIVVGYGYSAPAWDAGNPNTPYGRGFVAIVDLYTDGQFTLEEFIGLKMVNSSFGGVVRPSNVGDGHAIGTRHFSLAGAIRDVTGAHVGVGRTWIFDVPFLTTDAADVQPVAFANEVSTTSRFYGLKQWTSAEAVPYSPRGAIDVRRLDGSYADIAGSSDAAPTGNAWKVEDGDGSSYVVFRHVAVMEGGRYRFLFPGQTINWSHTRVDYGDLASDDFLCAFQHNAGSVSACYITTHGWPNTSTPPDPTGGQISAGEARTLTSVGSIATCASTPNSYFYESGQSRVWVHYRGGLTHPNWGGTAIGGRMKPHYIGIR